MMALSKLFGVLVFKSPQGQALSPRLSPPDTLLLAVGAKGKGLPFLSVHTHTFRYSAGYCTLGRKNRFRLPLAIYNFSDSEMVYLPF